VLALVAIAIAAVIALTSGGGGSHALKRASAPAAHHHKAKTHHAATKPKATTKTTPSTASTTSPPTAAGTDTASLNARQIQAYQQINGGNPAAGLAADQAILGTLAHQGYSVSRCREPASDQACLIFAHALFDVGHALRLLGQPAAAADYLRQRLQIDDQRSVVLAELQALKAGAGKAGKPGKGPKHGKHGHGPGGAGPAGEGD
jgi:hypothetical protein